MNIAAYHRVIKRFWTLSRPSYCVRKIMSTFPLLKLPEHLVCSVFAYVGLLERGRLSAVCNETRNLLRRQLAMPPRVAFHWLQWYKQFPAVVQSCKYMRVPEVQVSFGGCPSVDKPAVYASLGQFSQIRQLTISAGRTTHDMVASLAPLAERVTHLSLGMCGPDHVEGIAQLLSKWTKLSSLQARGLDTWPAELCRHAPLTNLDVSARTSKVSCTELIQSFPATLVRLSLMGDEACSTMDWTLLATKTHLQHLSICDATNTRGVRGRINELEALQLTSLHLSRVYHLGEVRAYSLIAKMPLEELTIGGRLPPTFLLALGSSCPKLRALHIDCRMRAEEAEDVRPRMNEMLQKLVGKPLTKLTLRLDALTLSLKDIPAELASGIEELKVGTCVGEAPPTLAPVVLNISRYSNWQTLLSINTARMTRLGLVGDHPEAHRRMDTLPCEVLGHILAKSPKLLHLNIFAENVESIVPFLIKAGNQLRSVHILTQYEEDKKEAKEKAQQNLASVQKIIQSKPSQLLSITCAGIDPPFFTKRPDGTWMDGNGIPC